MDPGRIELGISQKMPSTHHFVENLMNFKAKGSTLRAIQNNLNRYDDWLCVWLEGMWDDECSS
ncbi:hypothetical protein BpHYR1_043603 [Brachionus plicatilis]|uniref:Uncharacterized protein n=1 Tax=Brachionus plicatilis TaxID=10195 RepID=A0A3M7T7W4_BRAPC|nr:hypothetical protein BpHYR1_043603 [Brachionus plicatilis]